MILNSYIKEYGLVKKIQIDSYNDFISYGLPQIIDESGPIVITHLNDNDEKTVYNIKFGSIEFIKPSVKESDGSYRTLYPNDARIRNLSYQAGIKCSIHVNITYSDGNYDSYICKEIIGYIPVMVNSNLCLLNGMNAIEKIERGECKYDEGGYFIIKGGEKVIISQERMANNIPFCFFKKYSRCLWSAEIRCKNDYDSYNQNSIIVKIFNNNSNDDIVKEIKVELPYIRPEIPLFILFSALGFTIENAINLIYNICKDFDKYFIDNMLFYSINEYNEIIESIDVSEIQNFSLNYIGLRKFTVSDESITESLKDSDKYNKIDYAINLINNSLFSHLNGLDVFKDNDNTTYFKKKGYFLCYILNKLFTYHKKYIETQEVYEDDRDYLPNKRIDLTGPLMYSLFKTNFKRMKKETQTSIEKSISGNSSFNLSSSIKQKTITNGISYCFSTGNWGYQSGSTAPRLGVAQVLNRLSYNGTISHLRKSNTSLNKEGKLSKPRQLHNTQWGYICPIETPEGQGCGLIKVFSIVAHVTIGSKISKDILLNYFNNLCSYEKYNTIRILIDGIWLGFLNTGIDIKDIISELKDLRRKNIIHIDTSISLLDSELHIFTGPGRFTRPLIVSSKFNELLAENIENNTFSQLIEKGFIENIDPLEEETTLIATYPKDLESNIKYTHMEIDPSLILGLSAGSIPYSHHNQCIYYEEYVLMADGTKKMIKDINIGDEVVTWNPETMEMSNSKVEYHYVNKTEKDMFNITTLSGDNIKATYDHKFWTNKGFIEVKDFDNDTLLAVCINKNNKIFTNEKINILNKQKFIDTCNKYNFKEKTIEKYLNKCDQFFNEISINKISILAGIIGFILADGCITTSKNIKIRALFNTSSMKSANNLLNDIEYLGFNRNSIKNNIKTGIFYKNNENEKIVKHNTYDICYYGCLPILLESLGVTTNKKTNKESVIPEFILNGHKEIQRSFLAGLFGGDGSRIRYNILRENGASQVTLNTLSMTKSIEFIESLENFMSHISIMLQKFDIKVNYIHKFDSKNELDKKTVHLGFSQETNNIIKFYEEIGYKYDNYKNMESAICIEYLKYKNIMQQKRINDVIMIRKDLDNKLSIKDIMNKHNKTYNEIESIKKSYLNNNKISSRKNFKDFMPINDFISKCIINENVIYIPIKSIEPFYDKKIIADITVESNNHTFISSNFLVHNSPRNIYQCIDPNSLVTMSHGPSKMIKDLVIGDEVITWNPINGKRSSTKVINHFVKETTKDIFSITTTNGKNIIATNDHKFWTNNGFKQLKDLIPNIDLLGINDNGTTTFVNILSIKQHHSKLISDITVESVNHTFIANDFLIHNSSMGKQALGVYALNYNKRFDTFSHLLHYPQKSIITSNINELLHNDELPSGFNVVIAIQCYTGYNQEDSIIFNKSAIDSGLFTSTYYKTVEDHEKETFKNNNKTEYFTKEHINLGVKNVHNYNYDTLDNDGIIFPGTKINENDVLIGKIIPIHNSETSTTYYKDNSISTKENGIVNNVILTTDMEGHKIAKVKIEFDRTPQIGDKFASKGAQKGTIGNIYRDEDMPYSESGIRPDIIINPHAIPSRMTIGHLIETLHCKLCCIQGTYGDSTTFKSENGSIKHDTVEDIMNMLEKEGFNKHGSEVLYNGFTGEKITAMIFMGVIYYQRLKHMVQDKIHSRARGPVTKLTRQPLEGRVRFGGLRFGEMEKDCLIAHGASNFLQDRLFFNSDFYRVHVCEVCGLFAQADLKNQHFLCKCQKPYNRTKIAQVFIPYACKLFIQELITLNIYPKLILK